MKSWPFVATWMELEGIMLSEINPSEKNRLSYVFTHVECEKLNRRPWAKGREKKDRRKQTIRDS